MDHKLFLQRLREYAEIAECPAGPYNVPFQGGPEIVQWLPKYRTCGDCGSLCDKPRTITYFLQKGVWRRYCTGCRFYQDPRTGCWDRKHTPLKTRTPVPRKPRPPGPPVPVIWIIPEP